MSLLPQIWENEMYNYLLPGQRGEDIWRNEAIVKSTRKGDFWDGSQREGVLCEKWKF